MGWILQRGAGPITRTAGIVCAVAALIAGGRVGAQDTETDDTPSVESARVALVEGAKGMARKGHPAEMRELFDLAVEAGVDPESLVKERERAEKRVKIVRKPARRINDVLDLVEQASAGIATALPDTDGDERRALSSLCLRIDADNAAARAALGHVKTGRGWVSQEVSACLDRRAEIDAAMAAVRQMDVPITVTESDSRVLEGVYGRKGIAVRSGRVSIHAAEIPEDKMRRVVRESVRAAAFARYLLTGKLELPKLQDDARLVWLHTTPLYDVALDWCVANNRVAQKDAAFKRSLKSFTYGTDRRVCAPRPEARVQTILFADVWGEAYYVDMGSKPQATLEAGHLNWVCLSYLGTALPDYGWKETKDATRGTSDLDAEARKRHEMWRLAQAGLRGSRSWMHYLTSVGEDPAWARTFLPEMGMILGDDRLKTTFVAQYLHERGRLGDVFKATDAKAPKSEVFEQAVGTDLAAFETAWDAWMLAPDTSVGLLQRLRGAAAEEGPREITAAERELLDYLDGIRQSCVPGNVRIEVVPLALDDELSAGCTAHAKYLALNPEQAAAWPDAHEEWPDREGFSPAGGWAGLHSVIAPGSKDGQDAIDGWIGTFYHRLPLLDPGLVRIGWGLEKGYAVLDSGSMVAPFTYETQAMWPPPRASDVPLRFNPELPNPVPGEDQSAWGYPVTLQLFRYDIDPVLEMQLFEGLEPGGTHVPCHYSTPNRPTNPEAAPGGAYCLIPKAHLKPGTAYTVLVTGLPSDEDPDLRWSFTTRD